MAEFWIETGTWVGDGTASEVVTTRHGRSKMLIVQAGGEVGLFKIDGMSSGNHKTYRNEYFGAVLTISDTGFTCTSNVNGRTYFWWACGGDDDSICEVISYSGNSTDNRQIATQVVTPNIVFATRLSHNFPVFFRTPDMASGISIPTGNFTGSLLWTNNIQDFGTNYVEVGNSNDINLSGSDYLMVVFADNALMEAYTYTGNGVDSTNRDILSFQPDFIQNFLTDGGGLGDGGVCHRWARQGVGDVTLSGASTGAASANLIQALRPLGFQVGSSNQTNQNVEPYYGWVSKPGVINAGQQVETLRPSGLGDSAGLSRAGAGLTANWQAVDEAVADDATSYVYIDGASQAFDYYAIAASAIPEGSVIHQIDVGGKGTTTDASIDTNSAIDAGVRLSGSNSVLVEDLFGIGGGSGVWADFKKYNISRPGGGEWTLDDLSTVQLALQCSEFSAGSQARCTQLYLEVHYTPSTVTPVVTDVQPRSFRNGDLVEVTGTGFKANQGNGKVELGDNHQHNLANKVQQNIDHWEDLVIRFIVNKGSLPPGQVFVFVTNDDEQTNDPPPPEDPEDLDTELEGVQGSIGGGSGQSVEIRLERIYAAVSDHIRPGVGRDRHFLMQRISQELGVNLTSGTRSFETNLALLYRELTGNSWTGAKSTEIILRAIEENL